MKLLARFCVVSMAFVACLSAFAEEPPVARSIAVPGEFLIRRAPGQDASRVLSNLRQRFGPEVLLVEDLTEERLMRVRLADKFESPALHAKSLLAQSFALASVPAVDQLEPVVAYRLAEISDDTRTMVAIADLMKRIGLRSTAPLPQPLPGPPLVVAVIDTGFYLRHEVFKGLMLPGADVTLDGSHGPGDPAEAQRLADGSIESHGTAMAGLIALMIRGGTVDGAPIANVKILPIRAATAVDGDQRILSVDAIKAFSVAISRGASIVSASWGDAAESPELMRKFVDADSAKVLVVAAAGNGQQTTPGGAWIGVNIDLPANRVYPASWHLPNLVSVAALDIDETLAGYSNWGPLSVQLAAPGTAVMTPIPGDQQQAIGNVASGYQSSTGTSVATPLVAGMAALYRAWHPAVTHRSVASLLSATVEKDPSLQKRLGSGGRLSGTKLVAVDPQKVPDLPVKFAAQLGLAQMSVTMADLLAKPVPSQLQPSGVVLRGRDSSGESLRTIKRLNFLVRFKSGQSTLDSFSGFPFAIGTVNNVRHVEGGLYSVGVDAVADGPTAKAALTKLPGVLAVEPGSMFKLY